MSLRESRLCISCMKMGAAGIAEGHQAKSSGNEGSGERPPVEESSFCSRCQGAL